MKKKCVPLNTYILTKNGYKTIEKILSEKNIDLKDNNLSYKLNLKICNKNGKLETIKYLNNNSKKNIFKITTGTGINVEATKDHVFYILNNHGYINCKRLEELQIGDILLSRTGDKICNDKQLITPDESYLLGIFYALDFLKLIQSESEFLELNINEPEIKNEIKDELINNFDLKIQDSKFRIYNSELSILNFIERTNLSNEYISSKILESSILIQLNFLRGLFDLNCSFEDNKIIKEVKNERMLLEIILLLKNIGIIAEKFENKLMIRKQEIVKFYNLIGFNNIEFERQLISFNLENSDFYVIPHVIDLVKSYYGSVEDKIIKYDFDNFEYTRENISKVLELKGNKDLKNIILSVIDENICYDEIVSIEQEKKDFVFDFEMIDTKTYLVNSFISCGM